MPAKVQPTDRWTVIDGPPRTGSYRKSVGFSQETGAVVEVRKVVGQRADQVEGVRTENGHNRFEVGEVARANERLRATRPTEAADRGAGAG
jgi:hypothetical protein